MLITQRLGIGIAPHKENAIATHSHRPIENYMMGLRGIDRVDLGIANNQIRGRAHYCNFQFCTSQVKLPHMLTV